MATSKIKAIKNTLKKAIDYITNPDKCDDGRLVYSHGCSVETADIEMELTARQGSGRGGRLAYHLIQSFSPEDCIPPEKALELGIEFARKVTGGQHEFVVTTHIDKEHTHNYIIFNSVDFVSHKKYYSDKKDKYRIRNINDEICRENDLSVLPEYDGKRKSKYENQNKKKEREWTEKLKEAIDNAVRISETFEDFLYAMELEGYEIKRGKHLAFHAPGQERSGRAAYTRSKSIGDDYTEDAIKARITNKENETYQETGRSHKTEKFRNHQETHRPEKTKNASKEKSYKRTFYEKRINLIVDISRNIKAQQSKGYEQALVRSNINTLVKTMNFLIEHNLTTSDRFQFYEEGKTAEYSMYQKDIKKIDQELLELSEKIKFTQNYKKNAHVFYESKRAKDPAGFAREHETQIVLYKASEIYFKRKQLDPKQISLSELFERYRELKEEKSELCKRSGSLKREIDELDRAAQNIENTLNMDLHENTKQQKETRKQNRQDREK